MEQKQLLKQKLNSKLAVKLLQKQKLLYQTLEITSFALFASIGVLGRSLTQFLPSVEPITFITLLFGSIFGFRKTIYLGAATWLLSNFFVFGGHGPWSVLHATAGALTGLIAYFIMKKRTTTRLFISMTLATLGFELIMNLPIYSFSNFLGYLSIPFILLHLISNSILVFTIPFLRKRFNRFFCLNERQALDEIQNHIKNEN